MRHLAGGARRLLLLVSGRMRLTLGVFRRRAAYFVELQITLQAATVEVYRLGAAPYKRHWENTTGTLS